MRVSTGASHSSDKRKLVNIGSRRSSCRCWPLRGALVGTPVDNLERPRGYKAVRFNRSNDFTKNLTLFLIALYPILYRVLLVILKNYFIVVNKVFVKIMDNLTHSIPMCNGFGSTWYTRVSNSSPHPREKLGNTQLFDSSSTYSSSSHR